MQASAAAHTILSYQSSFISIVTLTPNTHLSFCDPHHRLIFVLRGSASVHYGMACRRLAIGEFIFLKRDVCVELKGMGDAMIHLVVCQVCNALASEYAVVYHLPTFEGGDRSMSAHVMDDAVRFYLLSLLNYTSATVAVEPGLARSKMFELLFCLGVFDSKLQQQFFDQSKNIPVDIMSVVYNHLDKRLSLSTLARLAGRSLSSFKRDFYSINNMPPSRWIRQKKLEKAREMVAQTSLSITDISYMLSFEHAAHFSRLFKASFGVTPSEWRRTFDSVNK